MSAVEVRLPSRAGLGKMPKAFEHAHQQEYRQPPVESDSVSVSTSRLSRKFRIPEAPKGSVLASQSLRLSFDGSITDTGSETYARFPNGVHNVISRVRWRLKGNVVFDEQECNVIRNIERMVKDPHALKNSNEGYGAPALRSSWQSGRRYEISLDGIMKENDFPIERMGTLELEVEFEVAHNCLEVSGGTQATYTLSNLRLIYSLIQLSDPEKVAGFDALLSQGNQYVFPEWQHYRTNISATSNQISIPLERSSIRALVGVQRTAANLTSASVNDKNSRFERQNLTSYQTKIRGQLFPQQPIEYDSGNSSPSGCEMLRHLKRALSKTHHREDLRKSFGMDELDFNDSSNPQVVMAIDFSGFKPEDENSHIVGGDDFNRNEKNVYYKGFLLWKRI